MTVLGFRQQEIATLFVVMGVSGLATQTLLLPALLTAIGEKWVLVTALCCSTLEMAGLASASTPWMAYTAILIGAAGSMAFPAISAISSANTHPDEQGAVQVRPSLFEIRRRLLCALVPALFNVPSYACP